MVGSDQVTDGVIAFDKIYERGYKRIGFISGPSQSTRFIAGFLMAQTKLNEELRLPPFIHAQRTRR
jgi:DNA-binding LacI/PurR family transcriptional regulator